MPKTSGIKLLDGLGRAKAAQSLFRTSASKGYLSLRAFSSCVVPEPGMINC